MTKRLLATALTAVFLAMGSARANTITGLVDTGAGLSDGQFDAHYTVVQAPAVDGPSTGATAVVGNGFPFPYWITAPSGSNWISAHGRNPNLDPNFNSAYVYQLTFDLSTKATSLTITGYWAADNYGSDISLNGTSSGDTTAIGSYGSSFAGLTPFVISGPGNVGLNSIDFYVTNYAQNGGNPTGLLVTDISGVYTPASSVTEPASLILLCVGLMGVGLIRARAAA